MKTVLMLAPYFIPRRRVGALRPFKFVIHLKKMGWNVKVLTISDSSNSFTEKEKSLLEGVEIIEIKPPLDRTRNNKREKKKMPKTISLKHSLFKWIDKQTPLDTWIYLFVLKYFWVLKKAKASNPDLVWSTGDPWSGLWMGKKIAGYLDIPWVADFRDPWTLTSMNLRDRSRFSEIIDKRIEKSILYQADKVIFTSKSTEKEYANHYGLQKNKTDTIYNSYDSVLFNSHRKQTWKGNLEKNKLHVLFFGKFRRLSPAKPIVMILNRFQDLYPEMIDSIKIHSFGRTEPHEKEYITQFGFNNIFVEHPTVVPEKTQSVLNKADILLVSTDENRKNIIPAKLWDYLSVEKPILSITPNSEIKKILNFSGAGLHFNPNEADEVATYLKNAIKAKKEGKPVMDHINIDSSGREKFDAKYTSKKLGQIFDQLLEYG